MGGLQYTNAALPEGIFKNTEKKLGHNLLDNINFFFYNNDIEK